MSGQFSIAEMVQFFGETYRTIDLRVAAVRNGGAWQSAFAIVRCTYEELEQVQARLGKLEAKYTPVETEHFRIVMGVRPFSEWDVFCAEMADGALKLCNAEIHRTTPIEWRAVQRSYLDRGAKMAQSIDGVRWPSVEIGIGQHDLASLNGDRIRREVESLGYSRPYEAINLLCQAETASNISFSHDTYLSLPAFSFIEGIEITSDEQRVHVSIRRHQRLTNLKATVVFSDSHAGQVKDRSDLQQLVATEAIGVTERVSGFVECPVVQKTDFVEVRLTHPEIGELDQYRGDVNSLLPEQVRNILLEALRCFCPDPELDSLFIRAAQQEMKKKDASAAFELHVAWLLGLCGLSTIVLSKHENLNGSQTKVSRGSVDILACDGNTKTLLLVGCTSHSPPEHDFGNLMNVRNILLREVFEGTTVSILPVVFTAASAATPYKKVDDEWTYIPIVDVDDQQALLSLLRAGKEKRFFDFLANPSLSDLEAYE